VGWVVEGVLGLGLLVRAVLHVLGYLAQQPDSGACHPLDVEYGLTDFHIRGDATGHAPTVGERIEVAFLTAAIGAAFGYFRVRLGFGGAPDVVLWWFALNWSVVVGDPLWVSLGAAYRQRSTHASETATTAD
jgi:hypothetical protein